MGKRAWRVWRPGTARAGREVAASLAAVGSGGGRLVRRAVRKARGVGRGGGGIGRAGILAGRGAREGGRGRFWTVAMDQVGGALLQGCFVGVVRILHYHQSVSMTLAGQVDRSSALRP